MLKFDTHTHSLYSVDGSERIEDICSAAAEQGVHSVAITDHYEIALVPTGSESAVVNEGYAAICEYKKRSPVQLLCGIEIGGIIYDTEHVRSLLQTHNYDIVIGSLHGIAGQPEYYELDYKSFDYRPLLREYFELLYQQTKTGLFDVLAHLDYPTRYIRRMGLDCPLDDYSEIIDEILRSLAAQGKALEINCSGLSDSFRQTLPLPSVIKRFRELGGEYVTVASDAHTVKRLCSGFERAQEIALAAGFKYTVYYENRQAVPVKIDL